MINVKSPEGSASNSFKKRLTLNGDLRLSRKTVTISGRKEALELTLSVRRGAAEHVFPEAFYCKARVNFT